MSGRLYANWKEAQNEIARDLAELGVMVPPMYQSKPVGDDEGYESKELYNYSYTVLNPDYAVGLDDVDFEWVQVEWQDRLAGELNPGNAWQLRRDVWEPLLETSRERREKSHGPIKSKGFKPYGQFSYTYSERMGGRHIQKLIEDFKAVPYSRQLYLNVWTTIDETRRGKKRVPCSLGYHFLFRGGALHMTYMMRSCDFHTHWANDVCLASILLHYVAHEVKAKVGTLTHFCGSLHAYRKDLEGIF